METMPERLRAVLASHSGVRLGYVFGSAARGALRADSDVDVAVRFAARPTLDGLAALALNLEQAAGRRADVIDLDTAPPLLLREVVKEGRLLFAASDDERVAFETAALARYADTAHLRHVQAEYLHAWAEAHRALRAEVVRRKTRARSGARAPRCIGAHHAAKEIAAIPKAWSRH